jgi:GDP/UDP-N,N'-diacetylbacillosamine 2-epimerase (hydrolysing)
MRKVCVVTGTRAEYGLLRWVMEGIKNSSLLQLQVIATGMHLSPEFGMTVYSIEADGFKVDKKVEMLLSSDTPVGVTKSMGVGLIGFADALEDLKPDIVVLLGDRYEIFVAATAAMIARLPIAHLHGGETTEGSIDEPIRHSITKMSHFHFVAAEEYRKRVVQLGEDPSRVFHVGGLGVDSIHKLELLTRNELEKQLDLKFSEKNLLITFHPVTLEKQTASHQMSELLLALSEFPDLGLIFTMPNADTDGRGLFQQINELCAARPNAYAFTSLGQLRYFSCVEYVDAVVGNSSSGIAEVPSFKKATVDIGDRQRGRLSASSVLHCKSDRESIGTTIRHALSPDFQNQLDRTENPYGEGGASELIVCQLEVLPLSDILKKSFYDIGKHT